MFRFNSICFYFFGCVLTLSHCIEVPKTFFYYDPLKTDDNIKECQMALDNFAQSSSNYTFCTITNSQPIRACELCVEHYRDVILAHERILSTEVNGTKCKDKLINLDRLEIIESTYNNIKDLWYRGFCDKCFVWTDGKPALSNETKTFFTYFHSAKDCLNNHTKGDSEMFHENSDKTCKDCMDKYLRLNSFYESLKGTSETMGICMDIVDSMNATRSYWSGVLNCCKLRRTPELIFLCCTGIITALPVLFYLSAKVFGQTAPRINVTTRNLNDNDSGQCVANTSTHDDS